MNDADVKYQWRVRRLSWDWLYFVPESVNTLAGFTTTYWRISPVLGAALMASTLPPPSLVQGRGDGWSAATRQRRPASTRGRSRRQRGLPEMWLEAVHRDRRWRAADLHHEVFVAGDPDAVWSAISWRQTRRQRGRPHINKRGGAQRLGWRCRWRWAACAVRHTGKRRPQLADECVWGRLGGGNKLTRQGKRATKD